jgi:hypothetical protein
MKRMKMNGSTNFIISLFPQNYKPPGTGKMSQVMKRSNIAAKNSSSGGHTGQMVWGTLRRNMRGVVR